MLYTELSENTNLKPHYGYNITAPLFETKRIAETHWDEIVALVPTLTNLQLTGGEPMLVKRFYDLLDHLIEHGYSKNITLQITTNCSVLNPLIINRLKQFKKVFIVGSIDAVMDVAEYQRYGTDWKEVEKNCIEYAKLSNVSMVLSSTLTAYTVLDFSRLSNFFMKMMFLNSNIACLVNVVLHKPQLVPTVLNPELRQRAISELEDSIDKLSGLKIAKQLSAILETIKTVDNSDRFEEFVAFTKEHDLTRNQSFEKTFGYKLY
jgi:sulfatase maturation enzyme AslB (radical SAM superfamily)